MAQGHTELQLRGLIMKGIWEGLYTGIRLSKDLLVRKRFYIIFIIFFSAPCFAQVQYPVYGDAKRPKGKIRSFTESCYDTSNGEKVLVFKEGYAYSQKGQLVTRFIYDTIDSTANPIKISYIYEDDELTEEVGPSYNAIYLYDERGNKMVKKYSSKDDTYLERYSYNKNNLLVETVRYGDDKRLRFKETLKYTDFKTLLSRTYNVPDSVSLSYFANYSLEPKGNVISERVYAANSFLKYSITYFYDDHYNKNEETRYTSNGYFESRSTFRYRYDVRDNWVSMINKNKKSSYLTVRKINYY
jgi:hypothetical protein